MAGPPASTLPSRSESIASRIDGPTNRPVSSPPPPPPGITPIAPAQRGTVPPAEAGEPFRPTLTTAAINNARAERQRTVIFAPPQNQRRAPAEPPATPGRRATHGRVQRHRSQHSGADPPTWSGDRAARLPGQLAAGQQPGGPGRQFTEQPGGLLVRWQPWRRGPDRSRSGRRSGSPRRGWRTTCRRSHPCCGWWSRRHWLIERCGRGSKPARRSAPGDAAAAVGRPGAGRS